MDDGSGPRTPIVLGIDGLRALPRATRIARTSRDGILLLEEHRDREIDELWLDHDLGATTASCRSWPYWKRRLSTTAPSRSA
ncbi:cyclic-phosphate processing receiver domain-containing protein [Actinoallomurus sp. NPDC052308]|uniref:cyclic-phosphate processing receiver domain-containing protein n=1 Tax=Actinoallomurus sp. NPDC052308 TaxID=3155530 RepID=UPI003423182C